MRREIITTKDGSKTIHLPDWNESYHSQHGAYQEAVHVFIKSGLHQFKGAKNKVSILEVGYGTGLNALITCKEAAEMGFTIEYEGLEAFPVTQEEWEAMDYTALEALKEYQATNEALFRAPWNVLHNLTKSFSLFKRHITLQDFLPNSGHYDLIYFDAFGPRVQPEMWTLSVFQKLYNALNAGGIFVTYCCKGQVRRDLISAGFDVEKIPGPPGKREMLRAFKQT
jgi:tRNA U34 5-methylaminomethyl-2-thiouridine-forming methyltransferase MnmC